MKSSMTDHNISPVIGSFEEALCHLTKRFTCIAWDGCPVEVGSHARPANISPTGRKYIELRIGYGDDAFYLSSQAVSQAWLDQMFRLGANKTKIYWRIEPECDNGHDQEIWRKEVDQTADKFMFTMVGQPIYRIYCRCDFDGDLSATRHRIPYTTEYVNQVS